MRLVLATREHIPQAAMMCRSVYTGSSKRGRQTGQNETVGALSIGALAVTSTGSFFCRCLILPTILKRNTTMSKQLHLASKGGSDPAPSYNPNWSLGIYASGDVTPPSRETEEQRIFRVKKLERKIRKPNQESVSALALFSNNQKNLV